VHRAWYNKTNTLSPPLIGAIDANSVASVQTFMADFFWLMLNCWKWKTDIYSCLA